MKKHYVYTEKAERRAKELGLDERKVVAIACLGYEPLTDGMIARAWLKKGYIKEADTQNTAEGR